MDQQASPERSRKQTSSNTDRHNYEDSPCVTRRAGSRAWGAVLEPRPPAEPLGPKQALGTEECSYGASPPDIPGEARMPGSTHCSGCCQNRSQGSGGLSMCQAFCMRCHIQPSQRPHEVHAMPLGLLTDEETEAQRHSGTCSRSHSRHMVDLGLKAIWLQSPCSS